MGLLDAPAIGRAQIAARYGQLAPTITRTWLGNTGSAGLSNGTDTATTYRYLHTTLADTSGVRIVYTNYYDNNGAESDGPNAITIRAGVESPLGGTAMPVFFNGARSITLDPGGMAVSDPVGITLVAGEQIRSRTYVSVATAGQKWPIGLYTRGAQNEGSNVGNDVTTSGTISATTARGYGPAAILGIPRTALAPPVTMIVGDSITVGNSDTGVFDRGWVGLSLEGKLPLLHQGQSGDRLFSVATPASRRHRWAITDMTKPEVALLTLGINDLLAGATLANMQGWWQTIANYLTARGVRTIHGFTLGPQSTSTDAWATTTNQTPSAQESVRVAFNDWLRTKPAPMSNLVEFADVIETGRNTGLWKPNYTADGTHPTTTGYTALASAIPATLFGSTF